MSNSGLREVPDGEGYLLPFMLSALVHVLLGSVFWLAPELHHVSDAADISAADKALPGTLHAAQALNAFGARSPAQSEGTSANTRLLNTGTMEFSAEKQGSQFPKAAQARPDEAARAGNAYRSISGKADHSLHRKASKNSLLAAKPPHYRLRQKNGSAALKNKTGTVAAKPGSKNMRVRHAYKESSRRNEAGIEHAEAKRMEGMREAELRRISRHIS